MKHIFLTVPIGSEPGLTSVSIGLVRTFDRLGSKVSYYKPFSQSHDSKQEDPAPLYIQEVTSHVPPAPIPASTWSRANDQQHIESLLQDIIENVNNLMEDHDVLIIEGLIAQAELSSVAEINTLLARSLNAETILVIKQRDQSLEELKQVLDREIQSLSLPHKNAKPAVVINRYKQADDSHQLTQKEAFQALKAQFNSVNYDLIGAVPNTPAMGAMRIKDFLHSVQASVIHEGDIENRRILDFCLCARQVENLLGAFRHGSLIVTPADRSDVITAAALAASKGIQLAGLVLTGNTEVNPDIYEFCQHAFKNDGGLSVLRIPTSSFEATTAFLALNNEVPVNDTARINLVMDTVARGMDTDWLRQRCSQTIQKRLSPVAFKHRLSRLAAKANKRILLPEGEEPRTIEAAIECSRRKIARCVLIGDPLIIGNKIESLMGTVGEHLEILDPAQARDNYIEPLVALRKHKGVTASAAKDALLDNITLATMMVTLGEADGLVSGATHSTAHTIRPALSLIKTAPNAALVSSIFFMCLPDQVLIYGDCAVNPNPNAEQLADIALQSAASASAFGIEPRVAMISYSTLGSGSGSDVEKVTEATRIAKERMPELIIDGPLQYDAATNASVAATKAPDSPVAGNANVFIFPDLNTGNTTYKAVQRSAQCDSIGPMLQGLNRPVNDLSRGTSVEDIIYTVALTAIQASQ
ncbi:phosphate acetyltransferase [Rubritalea spongiae]|uniref:Phosphate acetyltransferase n=1 Tax=Rubritalea spongiae TaxID=430797 RepID=A0ABW5DZN5_9BACT